MYLELGTSIHLPFEEPVFDAVVLSEEKDKKEVLIFAAPEENVMEYSQLFSDVKASIRLKQKFHHLPYIGYTSIFDQAQVEEDLLVVQFNLNYG